MFLSKALLRYLSLAVPEAGTGVTFKRVTLAQRNSASTQRSVSVQGLKHLCISNTYIYILSICGLKDLTESKRTAVCLLRAE